MLKILYLIILASVSATVSAAPELKGSPEELRGFLHPYANIVTISGQAEERAFSDIAIVSLIVHTEDKLLSKAIAENSDLRQKIRLALIETGISAGDINNSKFSSSPEYGWFGRSPISFNVVNRIAITISNEHHLQEIAAIADKYAEIKLGDTAFKHSQKDALNQMVKSKALEKVLKQKEYYEKSLNLKLVAVGVRDAKIQRQATRGASMIEEIIVTASTKSERSESDSDYRSHTPTFDEIEYSAEVHVDFKIVE